MTDPVSVGAPPLSSASSESAPLAGAATAGLDPTRGRDARLPGEIPRLGWWDIARRVFARVGEESFGVLSAGIAFYAMLAVFPALGAIVTLYALAFDPSGVQAQFDSLAGILPAEVAEIFRDQLSALASREQQSLGFGVLIGVLFAVWSARRGVDALVRAVTIAYRERETRNFLKLNALTYGLTLGAVMVILTTLALLVALPALLAWLPLSQLASTLSRAAGWVLFVAVIMLSIGVLYRVGPPRASPRWRWLSVGALLATALWVLGSAGFSVYVGSFGTYNETYGTLGAIIVLLLWLYVSAYAIVLGALVNAEMEHQTARDTTTGEPQPIGERGATVADTLGRVPGADD